MNTTIQGNFQICISAPSRQEGTQQEGIQLEAFRIQWYKENTNKKITNFSIIYTLKIKVTKTG